MSAAKIFGEDQSRSGLTWCLVNMDRMQTVFSLHEATEIKLGGRPQRRLPKCTHTSASPRQLVKTSHSQLGFGQFFWLSVMHSMGKTWVSTSLYIFIRELAMLLLQFIAESYTVLERRYLSLTADSDGQLMKAISSMTLYRLGCFLRY